MGQVVPKSTDHAPRDIRNGFPEVLGNSLRGLTNDLQISDYGVIGHAAGLKIFLRQALGVGRHLLCGLQDVLKKQLGITQHE